MPRERQIEESILEDDIETTEEDETTAILNDAKELATEEIPEDETPEQSARAALKEIEQEAKKTRDTSTEASPDTATNTSGTGKEQQHQQQGANEQVAAADVAPPQRLSVLEKEIFNKMPKRLRVSVARMFRDHEAHFTKTQTEVQREYQESRGIREAVAPFATDFAERGFTLPQGIAALCAAQRKLTDPKTSKQTYLALGRDLGINFEELLNGDSNKTQANYDISSDPKFQALQSELNALKAERATALRSKEQQDIEETVQQFETVVNETDAAGRYKYPELHDGSVLKSLEPLVSGFLMTIPNITPAQALKRAWHEYKGIPMPTGNQQAPNQARLQAASRVVSPVSVRGRTAPSTNGTTQEVPIGKNETPEQSARIALEELMRGV